MQQREQHVCFGGMLEIYEHESATLGCKMKFSVFLPPQAKTQNVPFITFLSGLTCTHENFTTKACAYEHAAREGLAIIAPDTSPRGDNIADDDAYDFGQGAGFYINATQKPWADHFQMEDYIVDELSRLVCDKFPLQENNQGVCGHSMGGHGALTLALKYPEKYKSVSAFSPIVAPTQVPWGQKAFQGYLGDNKAEWEKHDACILMAKAGDRSLYPVILIDQGTDDNFLAEQLKPHLFEDACADVYQKLNLRMQDGYDHSYYFIQSFIKDHILHHKSVLAA